MQRRVLSLALLACLAAVAACRPQPQGAAKVVVIGGEPKLVDPAAGPLSAPDAVLLQNVAQGLVRFDASGNIVGGLAERWNVSDDGLSYIFRLQTGNWPDGRKIRADEVARILSRQLRETSNNPLKDTLGAVDEIVSMTDRVIEIRLLAPRPNLLQLLAQPELGLVRASVGTGPFLKPTKEEEAAFPVDDDNKGALLLAHRIHIPDAEDPIEKIRMSGGDARKLAAAFADGKLDLVVGGTVDDLPIALAQKMPRGALRFDPVAGLFGLAPTIRSSAVQEADVRRLLSRAIDRQALIAGLRVGGLVPRATLLQAGLEGIGQPPQPSWLGQPAEERRAALIAEANRIFGSTDRPTFRIAMPNGPGGRYLLARLGYDWGPLGIRVALAPSAASADFVWVDEVAPSTSPAWFVRRFRCGVVAICVEDAEPLLAQARATVDARQRAELLFQAGQMMDQAQLFIPIAAPIRWSLVSGRAPGFAENPFARHTLVGLANERFSDSR